jgi:hypothetical protein
LRVRFNGLDAIVLVFFVALAALLVQSELRHAAAAQATGINPALHPVEFSVTTLPTHYASALMSHMEVGGQVSVEAGGNFVTLGTLESVSEQPYSFAVTTPTGAIVVATDPTQHVLQLKIAAQASVVQKTVTINGIGFYIDEGALFREGGSQFEAVITDEQVR